jgi:hypothetical protein
VNHLLSFIYVLFPIFKFAIVKIKVTVVFLLLKGNLYLLIISHCNEMTIIPIQFEQSCQNPLNPSISSLAWNFLY